MESFEIKIKTGINSTTMGGGLIELKRCKGVSAYSWIGPILHNLFVTIEEYIDDENYFEFYLMTDFIKLKLCYDDNNLVEVKDKIEKVLIILSDCMTYSDYSHFTNLEKYFYSPEIYNKIKKLGCEYTSECWESKLIDYK